MPNYLANTESINRLRDSADRATDSRWADYLRAIADHLAGNGDRPHIEDYVTPEKRRAVFVDDGREGR